MRMMMPQYNQVQRSFLRSSITLVCFLLVLFHTVDLASQDHPHVLFIAVDDLRPELGCYGVEHIHTPHIDQLAEGGTTFLNSYCNIPVCGASRASVLTGLRPTMTRFKSYLTRADEDAPNAMPLPQLFKSHGYTTISNGKISHNAKDQADSWDEIWRAKGLSPRDYVLVENIALDTMDGSRGRAVEMAPVSDTAYRDGKMTQKSIRDLQRLSKGSQPFFLAVGYQKPHLPFNAPKKYWDLYPNSTIELPSNRQKPKDVPAQAWHNSGELRHYTGIPPKGSVGDSIARSLIQGYYACVSYTDALIGELLDALDTLGLSENTIVVLWGDHGWNLYEHGLWCKHSNYRTSLKAPLIFRVPGKGEGVKRKEMVEFVDIYPTLQTLANLPDPGHLEGNSLVPLLSRKPFPWKNRVESVWKSGFTYTSLKYAYTRWLDKDHSIQAELLFDHKIDPEENHNLMINHRGRRIVKKMTQKNLVPDPR